MRGQRMCSGFWSSGQGWKNKLVSFWASAGPATAVGATVESLRWRRSICGRATTSAASEGSR